VTLLVPELTSPAAPVVEDEDDDVVPEGAGTLPPASVDVMNFVVGGSAELLGGTTDTDVEVCGGTLDGVLDGVGGGVVLEGGLGDGHVRHSR